MLSNPLNIFNTSIRSNIILCVERQYILNFWFYWVNFSTWDVFLLFYAVFHLLVNSFSCNIGTITSHRIREWGRTNEKRRHTAKEEKQDGDIGREGNKGRCKPRNTLYPTHLYLPHHHSLTTTNTKLL